MAEEDKYMEDMEFDSFDEGEDSEGTAIVIAILKSASKSADNLTKLIVENNNKSNVAMKNEDIYEAYRQSFIVALTTISPSS